MATTGTPTLATYRRTSLGSANLDVTLVESGEVPGGPGDTIVLVEQLRYVYNTEFDDRWVFEYPEHLTPAGNVSRLSFTFASRYNVRRLTHWVTPRSSITFPLTLPLSAPSGVPSSNGYRLVTPIALAGSYVYDLDDAQFVTQFLQALPYGLALDIEPSDPAILLSTFAGIDRNATSSGSPTKPSAASLQTANGYTLANSLVIDKRHNTALSLSGAFAQQASATRVVTAGAHGHPTWQDTPSSAVGTDTMFVTTALYGSPPPPPTYRPRRGHGLRR